MSLFKSILNNCDPKTFNNILSDCQNINEQNNEGKTLLHCAVSIKSMEKRNCCVAILLLRNANPDTQDNLGKSPVHQACHDNSNVVLHALISAKADIHSTNNVGLSPIECAQSRGNIDCIMYLLEAKANPLT